ncbi:PIN domain-containing protein [uncultured Brevundimonas sp.]|uniref:PIN domain-containing protein n=1 Tax=uncultured Brevundimonas sp. TaxID=213418 RepID=UPI00262782E3|nr:PIN domain-containing protein [uncultured Brevundimonas sp.]
MIAGAEVFLDTNILIYAAQGGRVAPEKREIARRIILQGNYGTSGQVLAEFYSVAIRKGARPLTPETAAKWVRTLAKKPCQPIDPALVRAGIDLSQRYRISYWDAAIIAAAERLGARVVYSEDLNHGQTYGSVRVENPFLPA